MSENAATMPFTGERYVPEEKGNIAIEHIHRYMCAAALVGGSDVLDVACGEGYGSAILAKSAKSVIGVDIAATAIKHASDRYADANLQFIVGDCSDLPVADASVDYVISYETLEHHDRHEEFLSEIKRVLRPGGVLVISSPDRKYYSDERGFVNEFHVKELYSFEFEGLLQRHFRYARHFSQRIAYGSMILPVSREASSSSYILEDEEIESFNGVPRPYYNLAVASDEEPPCLECGVFEQPINSTEIIKSWEAVMAVRNRELDEARSKILDISTELDQIYNNHTTKICSVRACRVLFTIGVTFEEEPYGLYLTLQAYHLRTFVNIAAYLQRFGIECLIIAHPDIVLSLESDEIENIAIVSLPKFDGYDEFISTISSFQADFHFVWNGYTERELVKVSRSRSVKVVFCEVGWLAPRETFIVDFNGVCANTSLPYLPVLDQVLTQEYFDWRHNYVSGRNLQKVDLTQFVYVPLSSESMDFAEGMLPFESKADFLIYLRSIIDGNIVVRTHPGEADVPIPDLPNVYVRNDLSEESWIEASSYVVGCSSAALILSLLYDKVVFSCGRGFFPAHYGATLHFAPHDDTKFPSVDTNHAIDPFRKIIADKLLKYLTTNYQLPRSVDLTDHSIMENVVMSEILSFAQRKGLKQ